MDYNFNYCGGSNMMRRKLKIQEAAANFLAQDKLKKEEEAKKLNEDEKLALMNSARYTNASSYMRGKERARRLQESLQYRDKYTKSLMKDYIVSIVENSLLIDSEEYAQLNPNYKNDIGSMVSDLLENADINENISNEHTLSIIEHISKNLPMKETGVLLSEEEISNIITKAENDEVNNSLEYLSGGVQDKVTDLVAKEKEVQDNIQHDLDEIFKTIELTEARKAPAMPTPQEELPPEELPPEEVPAEEMPPEEMGHGEVPPEELPPEELPPEEAGYESYGEPPMEMPKKTTSIEIAPDGRVKIKTSAPVNERFIQEIPKQGLLETLSVNEGLKMVSEGKEYNGDLALANALTYITVLETFNEMGLLNIGEEKLREVVKLAGGIELR